MKKLFLFSIFFYPLFVNAQYKVSGIVTRDIRNPITNAADTRPALGSMVYAYPVKDRDSTFSVIQEYLDAYAQYNKYNTSMFHHGLSFKAYKEMKDLRDSTNEALAIMMSVSKSQMVDAQGNFNLLLAEGKYIIFFYDKNTLNNFVSNMKKVYSPVLNISFERATINSDININHAY